MTRVPWQELRGLRWCATLLALFALLGVGQILPALHFALVAHRICAEHGEALHVEAEAHSVADVAARESDADASQRSADVAVHSGPTLPEHEHEHCGVLGVAGSSALVLLGPECTGALVAPWCRREPELERAAHVDIALLMYAPKLAPPA